MFFRQNSLFHTLLKAIIYYLLNIFFKGGLVTPDHSQPILAPGKQSDSQNSQLIEEGEEGGDDDPEKSYFSRAKVDEERSLSSDSFSSSLNNSSSFSQRLKGILKKPRSCSESESTATFYNNGDSLTNSFKNCFISSSSSGSADVDVSQVCVLLLWQVYSSDSFVSKWSKFL